MDQIINPTEETRISPTAKMEETATHNNLYSEPALTMDDMAKLLKQSGKREKDERAKKEESKRLNGELVERNHRIQQELSDAKDSHEKWRLLYSAPLSEKINLIQEYGVSAACPLHRVSQLTKPHLLSTSSGVITAPSQSSHRGDCQHCVLDGGCE